MEVRPGDDWHDSERRQFAYVGPSHVPTDRALDEVFEEDIRVAEHTPADVIVAEDDEVALNLLVCEGLFDYYL